MGSGYQVTVTVRFNPTSTFKKKKKKEVFCYRPKVPKKCIFKRVITPKHKEIALIKLSVSTKTQKIPHEDVN